MTLINPQRSFSRRQDKGYSDSEHDECTCGSAPYPSSLPPRAFFYAIHCVHGMWWCTPYANVRFLCNQ